MSISIKLVSSRRDRGGAIAVFAAAADPRISALDLLNPWGDWPDWLKDSSQVPDAERAAYLKPEFLAGVAGLDPVAYLPQLHLKALRIQQIMDDEVTPPSARERIAASVPNKDQVVRYKDTTQHVSAWRKTGLTGWIKEQLQPPDEAVSRLRE
jgi:cephalosporin-C deacetylase-like acetyl esterase